MRVSDEDWAAWRQAAAPMSVTAWLHELAAHKIGAGEEPQERNKAPGTGAEAGHAGDTQLPPPPETAAPKPNRLRRAADPCPHPKAAIERLPYGTFCATRLGGCGTKIR